MAGATTAGPAAVPTQMPWRRTMIGVESLLCLAGLQGTVQLVVGVATPPDSQLPFGLPSWVLPGVWLFVAVALPSGVAAVLAIRRSPTAPAAVVVASTLLVVELLVQIPALGLSWLQAFFGTIAMVMAAVASSAGRRGWGDAADSPDVGESLAARRTPSEASIALYWLPLGAGGRSVRFNGRVYEVIAAAHQHRPARDLYHSALEIYVDRARYVVEMAPVWNDHSTQRGVVCEGVVGARVLGRSRWFRYEVRRWRDGGIPDIAEAVASPQILSRDADVARRVLAAVSSVPAVVWGRDELCLGEMWNSNSLIAWLLAREELVARVTWPANGRAPGWDAGLRLAARQAASPFVTPEVPEPVGAA